jgi:hypothetical protein
MANHSRLILQVAATTGIAIMLSAATPAVAAEGPVSARETATTANSVPSVIKHHASRRTRVAVCRYSRRVSSIRSDLGCSGLWCGRQFVLMVGIGY